MKDIGGICEHRLSSSYAFGIRLLAARKSAVFVSPLRALSPQEGAPEVPLQRQLLHAV
jgi:hypothetical protein